MGKQTKTAIAFGNVDGRRSPVWRFWHHRNEVYADRADLKNSQKFSFHSELNGERASLWCLLEPYMTKRGLQSRKLAKAVREQTPTSGLNQYQALMIIKVPHAALSADLPEINTNEPIVWVAMPTAGHTAIAVLGLTRELESQVATHFSELNGQLIFYRQLDDGQSYFLASLQIQEATEEIYFKSLDSNTEKVIFTDKLMIGYKKEHNLQIVDNKNGSFFVYYFAGYKIPINIISRDFPRAKLFNSIQIIDNSDWPDNWSKIDSPEARKARLLSTPAGRPAPGSVAMTRKKCSE